MTDSMIAGPSPWYRSLSREQWRVLFASNLGWLFDGFEIYALFLTVGFAPCFAETVSTCRRRAAPARWFVMGDGSAVTRVWFCVQAQVVWFFGPECSLPPFPPKGISGSFR